MRKYWLILIFIFISAVIFANEPFHLVIFHINDTHGHIWSFSEPDNPDIAGVSRIAYIISEERKKINSENGHVMFLHAGDANTGIPESDQLNAIPDFIIYNYMGLDAMAAGNHEFDRPLETLKMQERTANFPILSANYVNPQGKSVLTPYLIKDYGKMKVGVIGLTTEQTAFLEPLHLGDNHFASTTETLQQYLPIVRDKEKADVVIVLCHLGYKENPKLPVSYLTSNELAGNVNGIDVIVDGHSHTALKKADYINNTIVAQAGEYGKYLGRIDLWLENGKIMKWDSKLIPINLKKVKGSEKDKQFVYEDKEVPDDPYIKMLADIFYKSSSSILSEVIAKTEILLDGKRQHVRSRETNLSHLITDAMLVKTKADVAMINGGGIRASIEEGEITYKHVLQVLPFGNTLQVVDLKGKELQEVLNFAVTIPDGGGGKLQVAGLTCEVKDGFAQNVKINDTPLEPDNIYKVVTINYLTSGAEGYIMLKGKPLYDSGYVLANVVKDYIAALGTIKDYDDKPRIMESRPAIQNIFKR